MRAEKQIQPDISVNRLLEEAADEVARLDMLCRLAPTAASRALWLSAISALAGARGAGVRQLAAAAADPASAAPDSDAAGVLRWEPFVVEEERRVRSGAPLTRARLQRAIALGLVQPPLTQDECEPSLDAALRGTHPAVDGLPAVRGSAYLRAVAVAAEVDDRALAALAAALVLCAEGRTDVIRFLPFDSVCQDDRASALASWRQGDAEPWQSTALAAAAAAARAHRLALEAFFHDVPATEQQLLDQMGRAAISAGRALHALRDGLATTTRALAESLELSFPAAGDALERLEAAGLATEITGQQRGRVYAYTAALRLVDAASS